MEPLTQVVDIKPWWQSKIVWTQVIGVGAIVASVFGFNLTADQQVQVVEAVTAVASVVTVILKVFFTTTVTPSSAKKA